MKKLLSVFSIFVVFPSVLFGQSDLSVTDLKVPGQVCDYVVEDINKDGRADFLVSFLSVAGAKAGNRFISTFLQTPDGFYSEPGQTIQIDPSVIGFELANVSGDQAAELILLQKSGLFSMPFQNGNFRKDLIKPHSEVNVALPFSDSNSLIHFPLKVSLFNSDFDQLVVPSENSLVFLSKETAKSKTNQISLNTGSQGVSIQPEGLDYSGILYQVEVPSLKVAPFFSESAQDLVLVYHDKISVYQQDLPQILKTTPDFTFQINKTVSEVVNIREVADINGDGSLDLLVERAVFDDLVSREFKYEFYWGTRDQKGQTQIKNKPDQVISASGILVQYSMEDLNRDGRDDFVTMEANISVSNLLTSFVTRDMKVIYKFYLQKNQKFSSSPALEKSIVQDLNMRKDFNKSLLMTAKADIDGDGFHDLALFKDSKTLMVFSGLQNGIISSSPTYMQTVQIPSDARYVKSFQIFEPKRSDLVFCYGSKDPANQRSVIRIISR